MKTKGQMLINTGLAVSLFLAGIGGWITQNRVLDSKIETTAKDIRLVDTKQGEDIAALREAVLTMKQDNAEMRSDIKEILRAVQK